MKLLALFFLAAAYLFAQSGIQETAETLVPNSTTVVISATAYIHQISLSNETTSDVVCTIKSRGASPRTLFDDTVYGKQTGKSSTYTMVWPYGRLVPNGLTWSCATASAVSGTVTYRQ